MLWEKPYLFIYVRKISIDAEISSFIQKAAQDLLSEFCIIQDIHDHIPSLRDIHHHIDQIPGAS